MMGDRLEQFYAETDAVVASAVAIGPRSTAIRVDEAGAFVEAGQFTTFAAPWPASGDAIWQLLTQRLINFQSGICMQQSGPAAHDAQRRSVSCSSRVIKHRWRCISTLCRSGLFKPIVTSWSVSGGIESRGQLAFPCRARAGGLQAPTRYLQRKSYAFVCSFSERILRLARRDGMDTRT